MLCNNKTQDGYIIVSIVVVVLLMKQHIPDLREVATGYILSENGLLLR